MRRLWLYGIGAVLLAGAGSYFLWQRPLSVQLVKPESNVELRIYGLGSVEARVLSRVSFEVGGALAVLVADAGDRIEKGKELAFLRDTAQQARAARAGATLAANAASLAKAEAAARRSRSVLAERQSARKRQQQLAKNDVTTAQRVEEAERDEAVALSDVAIAEADIALIKAQGEDAAAALRLERALLDQHSLRAPYDAVVITRHAEAGAVIRAGDTIFTLIDDKTVWVQAYIDEERAGQLALGQGATIRLRSQPGKLFHGIVTRIGMESDRVNEERRIWLTCNDCPVPMYLGEQAEVRVTTGKRDRALMVPETAITSYDGDEGTVWLLKEGKLTSAKLKFGARDDAGRVEVLAGLPEGAEIVTAPVTGAREGRRAAAEDTP